MSSRIRTSASRGISRPTPGQPAEPGMQRSLALLAARGGVTAALAPLGILMLIALIGWFLSDGGIHGSPRDALRVGALGWLTAHGSGVLVRGAAVTVLPLALTAAIAYAVWRSGLRTGERLSGHGPDALALADGERDLTVPTGAAIFTGGYVMTGVAVAVLAGTVETQPSIPAVLGWSLVLAGGIGSSAIAVGSGRAAVWLGRVPSPARDALLGARLVIGWFFAVATVAFVAALAIDVGAALSVFSQLELNAGGALAFAIVCLLLVPNAVIFAGSYLLGPGFLVGTGTVVSPTAVAVGAVPMFPLLAALPDNGPTPFWTPFLLMLPPVAAALAMVRSRTAYPTLAWDLGALRGLSSGVLAGVAFAVLAALAGGAAGPGRMAEVGPAVGPVLFHGIVSFGLGGLVGGVVATWLTRRHPPLAPEPAPAPAPEPVGTDVEPTVPLLRRVLRRGLDERGADHTGESETEEG